jgi:hypothetical protein
MVKLTMVSESDETNIVSTNNVAQGGKCAEASIRQGKDSLIVPKACTSGMSLIRESLHSKGLSEDTLKILMTSWRDSTQKQYAGYLQKWQGCCKWVTDIVFTNFKRDFTVLNRAF